jgi:hypothetical protein
MEPATEKQIAYIKSLGGFPAAGLTKATASDLIGKLLEDREESSRKAPPTDSMAKRITALGGCVFRSNPDTHSDLIRTPVLNLSGHLF